MQLLMHSTLQLKIAVSAVRPRPRAPFSGKLSEMCETHGKQPIQTVLLVQNRAQGMADGRGSQVSPAALGHRAA